MTVIKVRASEHSKDLRLYEIGSTGITVGETAVAFNSGILTASPNAQASKPRRRKPA